MRCHGALQADAQGPVTRSFRWLMNPCCVVAQRVRRCRCARDGAETGSHFGLHRPHRTNQIYLKAESGRLVASQSDLPKEVPLPLPSRAGPCEHSHAAPESRRASAEYLHTYSIACLQKPYTWSTLGAQKPNGVFRHP